MKNKLVALILYIVVFFAVWNLLDFLIAKFFTHSAFTFSVLGNAVIPTVIALVTGWLAVYKRGK